MRFQPFHTGENSQKKAYHSGRSRTLTRGLLVTFLHSSNQYLSALACATLLYNVVDSPVGVLPVTRVRATSDAATTEWTDPRVGPGHGSPVLEGLLYGKPDERGVGRGGFYDAEKMAGLPVGVQVVGRRWEEEKVVEMMKVLDRALGPRGFGPLAWSEQRK